MKKKQKDKKIRSKYKATNVKYKKITITKRNNKKDKKKKINSKNIQKK